MPDFTSTKIILSGKSINDRFPNDTVHDPDLEKDMIIKGLDKHEYRILCINPVRNKDRLTRMIEVEMIEV